MRTTKLQNKHEGHTRWKLLIAITAFLIFSPFIRAQVTIGAGDAPQEFSILEIVSNQKGGLRLPHLSTAVRNALSATTEFKAENHRGDAAASTTPGLGLGLTIYNTDTNCIEYWDGYKWVSLCLGTADIVLKSDCGDYDPQSPPLEAADGSHSGCGTPATLTVTDNSGSTAPMPAQVSATNGGILCNGGNVILTANTTLGVQWYQNGIPNRTANPLTLLGATAAGQWFAAVQDGGCISNSSNMLTLIDNTSSGTALPIPVATVNGQPQTGGGLVICKGGTLKLEITNAGAYPAGTSYEWFNNGISIARGTAPVMYLVAPSTTDMILSVMASDQSGSCPNTAVSQKTPVTFTSPNATSINNDALQAAICGGTPATLIAGYAGAAEYEWMKDGFTVPGNTQTLQTTQAGSYTVRYKDAKAQGGLRAFGFPVRCIAR